MNAAPLPRHWFAASMRETIAERYGLFVVSDFDADWPPARLLSPPDPRDSPYTFNPLTP